MFCETAVYFVKTAENYLNDRIAQDKKEKVGLIEF